MSFLDAEWRKLIIANYSIDCNVLKKYIPRKTELDIWEDNCYVSLVGFKFVNTKMFGVKIPFHINFEEVNLRFYVRYKEKNDWKRGVVFIKELVPRRAITFVANTFYKEHYQTTGIDHFCIDCEDQLEVEYKWRIKNSVHRMNVKAKNVLNDFPIGCETEFITEHYWGYTKINENKTTEYEVKHPRWQSYEVTDHKIEVDFGIVYGDDFHFLNNHEPKSVMLAEGSLISVENKRTI